MPRPFDGVWSFFSFLVLDPGGRTLVPVADRPQVPSGIERAVDQDSRETARVGPPRRSDRRPGWPRAADRRDSRFESRLDPALFRLPHPFQNSRQPSSTSRTDSAEATRAPAKKSAASSRSVRPPSSTV